MRPLLLALTIVSLGVLPWGLAACGDDDDPVPSNTAVQAEPDPEADPDPEPDPEAGAFPTVAPRPEGSIEVNVTLSEWEVVPDVAQVDAGMIYFLVENDGPEDAHEFVVIKTDLGAGGLPVEDGAVPEDAVDLIGEIEPFAVDTRAAITFTLEPGKYALICNVAEVEDGVLESHYQLGMRADFVVN